MASHHVVLLGSRARFTGALDERVYREKLANAGFTQIDVEPTRVYRMENAKDFLANSGFDAAILGPKVVGKFLSRFIRTRKPWPS